MCSPGVLCFSAPQNYTATVLHIMKAMKTEEMSFLFHCLGPADSVATVCCVKAVLCV